MTALDIFVLLALGGGALVGFVRGFVQEALVLAAWAAGLVALILFHAPVAEYVSTTTKGPTGAAALAFVILFLPAYIGMRLLAHRLGRQARASRLMPLDRLLGGGFGMLKGLVGATLFFLLANLGTDLVYGARAERPEWMRDSRTYPLLDASGRALLATWNETRLKRMNQK
ncbi:CvpA family protein [Sphingomonas glaciei]|uniref:CvpA family protein n=1 Tax=Sphingomonas glaciei TaxID=2938948 RepID=A0ABY5MVX1_9SPHN|nr:CvpA family protein [Sphingomonas glaciei]UUR08272.1 CvpA family protein [Sphingomonas glaciei]